MGEPSLLVEHRDLEFGDLPFDHRDTFSVEFFAKDGPGPSNNRRGFLIRTARGECACQTLKKACL